MSFVPIEVWTVGHRMATPSYNAPFGAWLCDCLCFPRTTRAGIRTRTSSTRLVEKSDTRNSAHVGLCASVIGGRLAKLPATVRGREETADHSRQKLSAGNIYSQQPHYTPAALVQHRRAAAPIRPGCAIQPASQPAIIQQPARQPASQLATCTCSCLVLECYEIEQQS